MIEPHRMKALLWPLGQDDGCIESIANTALQMRPGVDVDMQQGVPLTQLAQPWKQSLTTKQWQHAQPQSQQGDIVRLAFHRTSERFHVRVHRFVERLTFVGKLHRLARPGEQLLADEFLKIGDPTRQRRRAQADLFSGGTSRAQADCSHERFKSAEWG